MPDILGSLGGAVAGATPWGAIAQTALGIGQDIIGGIKAHKAQRQLENLQNPTYQKSKSITDYYNKALQRYNVNPYQSQQYQNQMQNIRGNQAAGINALQGRGGAVGAIAQLTALSNRGGLNAGVQAENEQNQRFGQLRGAANDMAEEDRMAFQQNQLAPFEKQYNLLAAKAGAANQTVNAGIQNTFGGLGGIQDYSLASKLYGDRGGNNYDIGGTGSAYSPDYNQASQSGLFKYKRGG